jgi:hypothetical protein
MPRSTANINAERPRALLVHAIAGRARLRMDDEHLADEAFFASLAADLSQHPAVREVRANAQTGSVLILHDGELQPILEYARERGLFEFVPKRPPLSVGRLRQAIDRVDERIAVETDDTWSLPKIAVVALTGAGLWQAAHGRLLPAGMTLFNYALEIVDWVAHRESTISPPRP